MPSKSGLILAGSAAVSGLEGPVDTGWSREPVLRAFRGLVPSGISPLENFVFDRGITALLTQDAAASYSPDEPVARRVFSDQAGVALSVAERVTEEIGVWDCVVESVSSGSFQARIVNTRTRREHFAEFEVLDVPAEERAMIAPGSLFYWHIYRDASSKRVSEIRMRRLPALFLAEADENWTNSILAVLHGGDVQATKI